MVNMMQEKEYLELHTEPLIPLNIMIDVDEFHQTMEKYKYAFRRWGLNHLEYRRYGLSLVNLNGELENNPDPCCYPLDQWNALLPEEERIYDPDFRSPTEVLSEKCFDCYAPILPYMMRSCILKWYDNSKFYPHHDGPIPSRGIRLWGTTSPDDVKFRFDENLARGPKDMSKFDFKHTPHNIPVEPGRLYLTDTNIIHDAVSTKNETFQFFIALDNAASDVIEKLKLGEV